MGFLYFLPEPLLAIHMPHAAYALLAAMTLAYLYLQIATTFLVLIDTEPTGRRVAQVAVVWLVPVLGALFVGYFKANEYDVRNRRPSILLVPMLWLAGGPKPPTGSNDPLACTSADPTSDDIWDAQ